MKGAATAALARAEPPDRWLPARRAWLSLRTALGALRDRPARAALSVLGVVVAVAALAGSMALVEALDAAVREAMRPVGVAVFHVRREPRFRASGPGARALAGRAAITLDDARALTDRLRLSHEIGAESWSWSNALRTSERSTRPECPVVGATPAFFTTSGLEVAAGRPLGEADGLLTRDVVVIGADIVDALFPGGPEEAVGASVRVRGRPFTIVGAFARQPPVWGSGWRNAIAAVPIETFEGRFFTQSVTITLRSRDESDVASAEAEARSTLREMRGIAAGGRDGFEVTRNVSEGDRLNAVAAAVSAAAAAICLVSLLVGGIGVMNLRLITLAERTREIGVRKAIGARPGAILAQFLLESALLCAAGGAAGLVVADAGVRAMGGALDLPARVPPWAAALGLAASGLVGILAGAYPAVRAARLTPVEALGHE